MNECFRRRLILEPAEEERENRLNNAMFKLITIAPPNAVIGSFRKQSPKGIRLYSVRLIKEPLRQYSSSEQAYTHRLQSS